MQAGQCRREARRAAERGRSRRNGSRGRLRPAGVSIPIMCAHKHALPLHLAPTWTLMHRVQCRAPCECIDAGMP